MIRHDNITQDTVNDKCLNPSRGKKHQWCFPLRKNHIILFFLFRGNSSLHLLAKKHIFFSSIG